MWDFAGLWSPSLSPKVGNPRAKSIEILRVSMTNLEEALLIVSCCLGDDYFKVLVLFTSSQKLLIGQQRF